MALVCSSMSAVFAAVMASLTALATATATQKMLWVYVGVTVLPTPMGTVFATATNSLVAPIALRVITMRTLQKMTVHVTIAHAQVNPPAVRRAATR
jgi:hypothetical protein